MSVDPRIALGIDPASDPLAHVELNWRVAPYTRAPHSARWREDVVRYHADRDEVAQAIRYHWRGGREPYAGRYRVGVLVRVPPCASGKNKGGLPGNVGDHDNYAKAVLDAMAYRKRITAGDDARYYAGPAPVLVDGALVASGWEMAETESTVITVWRAWDAQGVDDER